uniref:protein-tyrosine-phosphatase n=1 Tax=Cyprinus carpio TaxID=7962 RepID=A0A8C2KU91_CYPCA
MTARFRLPAGRSYNVRTTELARDRQRTEVVCNIFLLDNTVQPFKVNKHDQGQILLDAVFKHLELTERDYFGLHLADDSSDSPRWLDPNKPIRKQLKRGSPHHLNFRVKFFVSDPSKLQEEYTRGLTPAQSEFNYLNTARTLELYGVELHYARVSESELFHCVSAHNFKIFSLHFCLQHETRDTLLGFNMVNYRACKNLWKACVEHHTFFRLDRPVPPQKNFFAHYLNLGSKFRYCKPLGRKLMGLTDWESVSRNSLSEERLETRSLPTRSPPGTPNQNSLFVQEGPRLRPSSMGHLADHVIHASPSLPPNGVVPHDNLVLIKMKPDENGRFGFNVKGGSDQKMPIIVSRVAPGTSADLCVPRLNEGDQVVLINGRDIAEHTHDQVVMFIKASCESHSGELILLVRPNGEPWSDTFKSPTDPSQLDQDAWRDSMLQLKEGLNSATILAQFDQLYRKRPGMTMSCAKLPQNLSKNRYRDISPYDATRVILKGTDDYINANYINMEIPASSLINRYIACQGPLPNTCPDFWQMTWEQGSSLVVMLTTQVERGRVKCHQYWPNPSGSATYGGFQVSCQTEEGNSAFLVRDMTLTHIESGESRELTQIQYLAWPDHGVPDDSTDFLDFVALVRSKRAGKDEPVVVHCSAGIGRTGVLITMETAMCLMECGQPVHPLEIVRTMRDQRAMMIQTPVSPGHLLFFCHCLHRSSIGGLSSQRLLTTRPH